MSSPPACSNSAVIASLLPCLKSTGRRSRLHDLDQGPAPFRTQGDNSKSRRALADALASNPHVPAYLLGHKPLPRMLPRYTGLGDEREAVCLAVENIKAWQTTAGALAWLAQRVPPTSHGSSIEKL